MDIKDASSEKILLRAKMNTLTKEAGKEFGLLLRTVEKPGFKLETMVWT